MTNELNDQLTLRFAAVQRVHFFDGLSDCVSYFCKSKARQSRQAASCLFSGNFHLSYLPPLPQGNCCLDLKLNVLDRKTEENFAHAQRGQLFNTGPGEAWALASRHLRSAQPLAKVERRWQRPPPFLCGLDPGWRSRLAP